MPSRPILQACRNTTSPEICALSCRPTRAARSRVASWRLRDLDRLAAEILAVQFEQVEGVQENPPVLAPVAQPVEHRQSVAVAGHRLPVEQERSALQGAGGLEDQRKASRPVDPVAGEQA